MPQHLIFALLLILSLITTSLCEMSQCSMKDDCLSCEFQPECYWKNNECRFSAPSQSTPWYTKLSLCLRNSGKLQLHADRYCSPFKIAQLPFSASLSDSVFTDGVTSIFCQWTVTQFSTAKQYKFDFSNKDVSVNHFALELMTSIGTEELILYEKYSNAKVDLQKFKVFYYAEQISESTFNRFTFTVREVAEFPYFALLIIIFVIFSSVLGGLGIALWKSKLAQKSKKEKDENKQKERERLIDALLKQVAYKTVKSSMTTCMICLEQFNDDTLVCQFNCKHIYHHACIRKWIEKDLSNAKCPNCNQILFEGNFPQLLQMQLNSNENVVTGEVVAPEEHIVDNRIIQNHQNRNRTFESLSNRRQNNYLFNNSTNVLSVINHNSNFNLNQNTEPNSNGNSHRYNTAAHRVVSIRINRRN